MPATTNLSGVGVLRTVAGAVLHCGARYVLVLTAAEAGVPGSITGRIANPPAGGFPFDAVLAPLALELQDGREWACTLANTSGLLANRGQTSL